MLMYLHYANVVILQEIMPMQITLHNTNVIMVNEIMLSLHIYKSTLCMLAYMLNVCMFVCMYV